MNPETARLSGWGLIAIWMVLLAMAVVIVATAIVDKARRWWRGEK